MGKLKCPECGRTFPGEYILAWHRKADHPQSYLTPVNANNNNNNNNNLRNSIICLSIGIPMFVYAIIYVTNIENLGDGFLVAVGFLLGGELVSLGLRLLFRWFNKR